MNPFSKLSRRALVKLGLASAGLPLASPIIGSMSVAEAKPKEDASFEGHFPYSWGTWGDFPGGMWGVHRMHVDQQGNLYVAEVDSGRVQKYVPSKGANPAFLVGPPVKPVWT